MAEDVDTSELVGSVFGKRCEDDAGGTEHERRRSRAGDADAESGRLLVSCAGSDGDAARRLPRDLLGFEGGRQPVVGYREHVDHLVAPAAPGDVEEQRARSIRDVDRPRTGQPEPDVVLREADPRDPRVGVGLVLAEPEELRRGEAGERAIARELDQAVEAD
jgi:hypothetical protein